MSSTQTLVASTTEPAELRKQFGVDQALAQANLDYLKTLAKDMVSVLLNVFSKLPREQRGMVGDVIGLWAGIMLPDVSVVLIRLTAGSRRDIQYRYYASLVQPVFVGAGRARCIANLAYNVGSTNHFRSHSPTCSSTGIVYRRCWTHHAGSRRRDGAEKGVPIDQAFGRATGDASVARRARWTVDSALERVCAECRTWCSEGG